MWYSLQHTMNFYTVILTAVLTSLCQYCDFATHTNIINGTKHRKHITLIKAGNNYAKGDNSVCLFI